MDKLTKGQRAFLYYVEVEGLSQEKAYAKAYPNCKPENLKWAVQQILKRPSVVQYYAKMNKKLEEKYMLTKDKVHMAVEEVLDRGMQLVPAKDKTGMPILTESGEQVYVQLDSNAVLKSVNEFNKMTGGHAPVKQEVEQTSVDLTPAILKNLEKKHND